MTAAKAAEAGVLTWCNHDKATTTGFSILHLLDIIIQFDDSASTLYMRHLQATSDGEPQAAERATRCHHGNLRRRGARLRHGALFQVDQTDSKVAMKAMSPLGDLELGR